MIAKRLFYLVTYFITHLIFAQGYEDTLEVYGYEYQYFFECSDSLEKVYHVHFKQKFGQGVGANLDYEVQKVEKLIDKYGEEKYTQIINDFGQCMDNKVYNFYLYDCGIDTTDISHNILSYGNSDWGFILPHFEQNDTTISEVFKCALRLPGSVFTGVKMVYNQPKGNYDRMIIEVTSYSSTLEKEGCSWKRLMDLKRYLKENEMLELKHVKFNFKDYGTDRPIYPNTSTNAKKNNRIWIRVISI